MSRIAFVNGKTNETVTRDMTPEEQAISDGYAVTAAEKRTAFLAKREKEEADKASAKAKLIAGEALTEAEADTIVL